MEIGRKKNKLEKLLQNSITEIKVIIFSEDEFCKYNENNTKAVSEPKEMFPFASVSHHHGSILTLWTQMIVFNFKLCLNFCTFRSYRNLCLHKRNSKLATFLPVLLNEHLDCEG